MASNRVSIMKELHKLLRTADTLYDGQVEFVLDDGEKMNVKQEDLEEEKEETYMNIFFFVTPKDGLYRNARIKFHMRVHIDRYPSSAPEITCRNEVYHPNINLKDENNDDADICVNLLDSDWQPEVGLDGAVMAVLFLFYNPQLDDALSPVCDGSGGYEEYEENVRRSLRGEVVEGFSFDNLMLESADTEEEDKNDEIVVEESVVKDVESSKQSGTGSTVDNDGNSGNISDTSTVVDPKTNFALTENVIDEITADTVTTEHGTIDNDASIIATMTLESTVVDAEETSSPVTKNTSEKVDSGIVLLTSTIATESNPQTVHNQHTSKPSSVFEFWFSKLKKRLSPIYNSFNNRS